MFLLIDKPKGITSHDVVDRIRDITGERKVGHAGTLDPNATGLLIIGIGRNSTRKLELILKDRKTYTAEIILGEERDSDDVEGKIKSSKFKKSNQFDFANCQNYKSKFKINENKIQEILELFLGKQMQKPPLFSAVKINGKKAYDLARQGKVVELKPRRITIYSIKLVAYRYPILEIEADVSGGTYIRALARDIGSKIGCGAYLKELRRTKIGKLKIADSVPLTRLNKHNWNTYALEYKNL